ncbi:MAG: ABC transporter permease subunit, partial [Candidatus Binatia bacterium]
METTRSLPSRRSVGNLQRSLAAGVDFKSAGSILVLIVLGVLVIIPLLIMLLASIRPAGVMPLTPGVFTIQGYAQAYGGSDLLPIVRNTLIYAGLGVLFALPIAFGFAFLTERTDMPLRNAMYVLMFIPMSTPVFATALGWVLLLGPRGGTINVYLRALTGSDAAEGPFNIYSLTGLIFVHVLGMVPTMWLFLTAVLRRMDPVLEEAASAAGAGRWHTLRTITAPLMRPGVAAVAIYFFLSGLESLELPLALGPTAGIEVLATKIFFSLAPTADLGVNYGIPAAFGLLGLLMGVAGTVLYHHLVRQASDFAVVTGKGYRPRIIELGAWKYLALGAIGLFVMIKVVLPFAVLLSASFLRFYVPPIAEYLPDIKWTLIHYERLFDYRFFGRFFVNTLIV